MPTQAQIEKALKAGYTMEQINQELAAPWSVKRNILPTIPTTTPTPYVEQNILAPNVTGRTTPVAPVATPTNAPAPWSVSSILGEWFWAEDPFIKQYQQEQLSQYNQTIDPQTAYNEQLALRQAQIDATNALYRDQLNQARIQGQGRLGSGRAIQARSGLLGSSFGSAQTQNIQQANTDIENSIEQERLAVVNQIMTQARTSAAADIAEKRAAKEAGGKAYLEYLSGASERKKANTSRAAQLLLSLGKSPQDISDEELKQAGISRQDLSLEYTSGKSAQEAAQAKLQAEQEKAALDALKTQSEIDKNQADIINEALKTGRVYEQGGFIFDGNTNQVIGSAQAVTRARASGGGGGWTGTYTIWWTTYDAPLYAGMKSPTATAVRGQVSAFKSEPIVTNFNQIQEWYNFAKSISNTTKNPTDDQALIYSLAKVLDPGSVVREWEYATVQKYAQSWVDSYGKWVSQALNGTGFLSEQARKNIKDTIEWRYKASKSTYNNLYNQYSTGIDKITGKTNWKDFLRNYDTLPQDTPQQTQDTSNSEDAYAQYLKTIGK